MIHATTVPFSARLKSLRQQYQWSQSRLADAAGMQYKHIANLEQGQNEPSLHTLRRIARAFAISISELLEGVS